MRKILLALFLLTGSFGLAQAQVELKDNHPDKYTVVRGDTLWDISSKFLRQPWKWPEIWHVNPQVDNPHLIYPGDILSLVYIDGQPRIVADRGTIKLSPRTRSTPIGEAIPAIPLEAINSFLLNNRIIDSVEQYNAAPHVLGVKGERVLAGAGDHVYSRGQVEDENTYNIFRRGKAYRDPVTGEFLGINADYIGTGDIIAIDARSTPDKNVSTMRLSRSTQEIRPADRLFETEKLAVNSIFVPSEPQGQINGYILDVPRGVSQIGQFDVVTINKGARDGLVVGNVLAVYKTGETIRDRVTGDKVKVPDERSGLLMVFRTYEKISYGLVLNATRQLTVKDRVRNP